MLQIRHSLTIKQMAAVSLVTVFFTFVCVVILLFHFVQQQNYHTSMQMEGIARQVRQPLSAAILKADIPAAQAMLQQINPAGIVGRADVVLPDQFQALRFTFSSAERPVPILLARLFDIPQQISLPLYALQHTENRQPLAYLVLQADAWRSYHQIMSMMSTLIASWLLLSLVLSVAISWSINRLIVHSLRDIARQLNRHYPDNVCQPLPLPPLHHDDEIGMIIRNYNLNQQRMQRFCQQMLVLQMLPKKLVLPHDITAGLPSLLVIHCETLSEVTQTTPLPPQQLTAQLTPQQQHLLLLAMVETLKTILPEQMVLAQLDHASLVLATPPQLPPAALVELTGQLHRALSDIQPLQPLPQKPVFTISSAVINLQTADEQQQHYKIYSAQCRPGHGKKSLHFLFETYSPALFHDQQ